VLEDLHWIDEYTCEFLALLTANMPRDLAVVITYRREDLSEPSQLIELLTRGAPGVLRTGLSLGPLDESGVKELIGSILATDEVSDTFASYLFDRTAGLPFAVEEVLKLLQERRDLLLQDGRWIRRTLEAIEVPSAIRDSVLERLYRLSPNARLVVEASSVMREPASENTLREVAALSPSEARSGLSDALSAVVLQEKSSGVYEFRHSLAAQSVYESIASPRRRELHLRAGECLEKSHPSPLSRLLVHFQEADDTRRWVTYAEAAADQAGSLHDEKSACRFLREALTAPGLAMEERGRLAIKFGYAALHGLAHTEAIGVLQEIIAKDDIAPGVRGELRYFLSGLLSQSGDLSAARKQDLLSLPELQDKPALLARALTGLAFVQAAEDTVEQHLEWLDQAVQTAERVTDPVAKVAVAVDQASVMLDIGHKDAWGLIEALDAGRSDPEEQKEIARGYANLAQAALFLGHYDAAGTFMTRGMRICAELSYERFGIDFEVNRALHAWATGRWDGLYETASHLAESGIDVPTVQFKARMVMAGLLFARGEFDGPGAG
jgi:hypothetical protein